MAALLSRSRGVWQSSLCQVCQITQSWRHAQRQLASLASSDDKTDGVSSAAMRSTFANVDPIVGPVAKTRRKQRPRSEPPVTPLSASASEAMPEVEHDAPKAAAKASAKARRKSSVKKPVLRAAKTKVPGKVATKRKKAVAKAKSEPVEDKSPAFSQALASNSSVNIVEDVQPPERVPVPNLAHGLDRVLFNPGVYYLQDPRSHVYNFDPYLQHILPVEDFNFDALAEYITSSRDATLDELARENGLSVVGSTSSMTSMLAQFHFLLSANRPVNLARLSTAFVGKSTEFTPSQRAPTSIYLRHNDGIYAIDADKSLDSGETVLSFLGRSMEKMLTLAPDEFSKLRKDRSGDPLPAPSREAYHYSKLGSMLMRSQLDCHDPRLPGTGTFDLKTRAVLPVRLDVRNHAQGAGYQIVKSTGLLESFEREYYDMIRAAFLKYSLQVRIGKMDGIFVAFHNTERIFGFQYISRDEMDECLHGSSTDNIADREFVMSLKQLDKVLQLAIKKYPGKSMCLSCQTTGGKRPQMEIVVEPMTDEAIQKRQQGEVYAALKAARSNEQLGKLSALEGDKAKKTLESMSNTLESIMTKTGENAADSANADQVANDQEEIKSETEKPERMLLRIEGRSFINDKPVAGPPTPSATDVWQYRFDIITIEEEVAITRRLDEISKKRIAAFTDLASAKGFDKYRNELKKVSEAGRIRLNERLEERKAVEPILYQMRDSTRKLQEQYEKSFP